MGSPHLSLRSHRCCLRLGNVGFVVSRWTLQHLGLTLRGQAWQCGHLWWKGKMRNQIDLHLSTWNKVFSFSFELMFCCFCGGTSRPIGPFFGSCRNCGGNYSIRREPTVFWVKLGEGWVLCSFLLLQMGKMFYPVPVEYPVYVIITYNHLDCLAPSINFAVSVLCGTPSMMFHSPTRFFWGYSFFFLLLG